MTVPHPARQRKETHRGHLPSTLRDIRGRSSTRPASSSSTSAAAAAARALRGRGSSPLGVERHLRAGGASGSPLPRQSPSTCCCWPSFAARRLLRRVYLGQSILRGAWKEVPTHAALTALAADLASPEAGLPPADLHGSETEPLLLPRPLTLQQRVTHHRPSKYGRRQAARTTPTLPPDHCHRRHGSFSALSARSTRQALQ